MRTHAVADNTAALQDQLRAAQSLTEHFRSSQEATYGQLMAYVGDLRRAVAERDAAIVHANESVLAKTRFLGRVNHEFRTPLTTILGFSAMLRNGVEMNHDTALERIHSAAQSLLDLVSNVINLNDPSTPAALQTMSAAALTSDLNELLPPYYARAAAKGIRLRLASDSNPDSCAQIDRSLFGQMLHPVLDNAVKFTAAGEIIVRVVMHDDAEAFVEVIDTGIGIASHRLPHIFEPLEQGDGSDTRRHGGLGIGLALARSIAGLTGCRMKVASEEGSGTAVRIYLPRDGDRTISGYYTDAPMPSELLKLRQQFLDISQAHRITKQEIKQLRIDALLRLSAAAELKDNDTGRHIARMGHCSAILAQSIGQDADFCDALLYASRMHDVGKIGIPDNVLQKPGPLNADEWAIMRRHPEIGASLLKGGGNPLYDLASEVALSHHEKFDGSGYPHNLKGSDIPISGRIVALADYFDALTMDRCYRPAMSDDQAIAMIEQQRGIHFDPVLVDAFMSSKSRILLARERINRGEPI